MKIGLIDVDGHNFPNLALMKISAFHKKKGDHVEFYNQMSWFDPYDKVMFLRYLPLRTIFNYPIYAKDVVYGGTGYNLDIVLPQEIKNIYPDYSLYNQDIAYGYLTRGCPRGCKFCIVGKKEGFKSIKVADLNQFWNGQKEIKLLDPNILACKDRMELLDQLIKSNAWVDFTQGIDIRMMNEEIAHALNELKVKMIHFAWYNYEFDTYKKLKEFRSKLHYNRRKLGVYVLTNFNTTLEQDLERIYKLKELEYDPYVMIYNKETVPQKIRYLQRWVNNKIIFRSCAKYEDYNPKIG